jgi:hypothetical protein
LAGEVLRPQDVPALMPSVTEPESDTATERLASRLADPLASANGANRPCLVRPRPRLRPAARVAEGQSATESEVPTVLVYELPTASVAEAPMVSVN